MSRFAGVLVDCPLGTGGGTQLFSTGSLGLIVKVFLLGIRTAYLYFANLPVYIAYLRLRLSRCLRLLRLSRCLRDGVFLGAAFFFVNATKGLPATGA